MFKDVNAVKEQYELTNIWMDKEEFLEADVLYFHGALNCKVLDKVDKPSVLMNHSALRQHTFLFQEFLDAKNPMSNYFVKKNREEIIEEVASLLEKPDVVISNSEFIRRMTKKYFDVDSIVINPPVDREKFRPVGRGEINEEIPEDYYLSVQRMDWTKRVDAQIEAFSKLDDHLVIVGDGQLEDSVARECRKHDNIHYLGRVDGVDLTHLYSNALATIQTCLKEDFGLVPREGMACGTPAIVPDEGGHSEAIHNESCGVAFTPEPRAENLRQTVESFEPERYSSERLRQESERYDLEKSIRPKMRDAVKLAVQRHRE